MITINVVAFNGHPPMEPLSAEFDELGGSIGRGEGNTLVLPDPERHISRTHASVAFRDGRYVIQDRGSATPVQVNGHPLGQGRESPIGQGDKLTIGSYTLQVEAKGVSADHATRFGRPSPAASGGIKDDPLALFGTGASPKDPFVDLVSPAGGAKPPSSPTPSLMDDPFRPIPPDFDPLADLGRLPGAPPGSTRLPDDFDLGLGSSSNRNIDELLGLGQGMSTDPFAPRSPLSDPFDSGASGSQANADPLAALGGAPVRETHRAPPQRNDTAEVHGHFQPPEAKPDPAMAKPVSPSAASQPASPEPNMVLSWDEHGTGSGEIKTMIISPRRRELEELAPLPLGAPENRISPKGPASVPSGPADSHARVGAASSAADPLKQSKTLAAESQKLAEKSADSSFKAESSVRPMARTAAVSHPVGQEELLRAFLLGAGVSDLNVPGGLTLETMHMLGTVLREAMQGTLELLMARATIKREVRAEMTMIVARENNPLKFSPNVEAALAHLLAPQARGFMPPIKAMKDAYNDLRSHQIGFVAGMRAALAGVLLRFNPGQLEERLTRKRVLDSLLPMTRKAKLWDLFEDMYGDISREAEEDFHALFGKEFVRAYEAQIEKLEKEDLNKED
jgi:FHA domain-containing protein